MLPPALIRRCDDLPATITHVPVPAVLVLNTPDDERLRPKHVEWFCRSKTCTVLHQVGVSFVLYYDARKQKIKTQHNSCTCRPSIAAVPSNPTKQLYLGILKLSCTLVTYISAETRDPIAATPREPAEHMYHGILQRNCCYRFYKLAVLTNPKQKPRLETLQSTRTFQD